MKLPDSVRLTLAGLFVVVGLSGAIAIGSIIQHVLPSWLTVLSVLFLLSAFIILALVLFNVPGAWGLKRLINNPAIHAAELEDRGLLTSESFKAKRAFQVEEFEDEGSHYFLELENGSVLFMTGQYLYEYEPLQKRGEVLRSRRFPNTEFTVQRHKDKKYVIDIVCKGLPIEPEVVAPPFDDNDFKFDRFPEDGQVITGRTFEKLRNEQLKTSQS
jgi:hypothetical protein